MEKGGGIKSAPAWSWKCILARRGSRRDPWFRGHFAAWSERVAALNDVHSRRLQLTRLHHSLDSRQPRPQIQSPNLSSTPSASRLRVHNQVLNPFIYFIVTNFLETPTTDSTTVYINKILDRIAG